MYPVSLWYWYKPKARQQFLLYMRLHFRVTELVQCSLFVNRLWHQELGFRSYVWSLSHRGGVEDTRLEAKAKDTKKIRGQGQGQPFRGQTLSRPRPRTKDTKRKCSPKKKRSSQKFFQRSPLKNVFQKIFKRSTKF